MTPSDRCEGDRQNRGSAELWPASPPRVVPVGPDSDPKSDVQEEGFTKEW